MDKKVGFNLHKGDCIEFMKGMVERGDRVSAIITDPPYLYLNHRLDRPFDERLFFELASKITNKIIFFGRGDSFYKWNMLCAEFGFEFKEELIWNKKMASSPYNVVARVHETISVRMKKDEKLNRVKLDRVKKMVREEDFVNLMASVRSLCNGLRNSTPLKKYLEEGILTYKICKGGKHGITARAGDMKKLDGDIVTALGFLEGALMTSIITYNREHHSMEHPTQKPFKMLQPLVELISNEGDIIFDPFSGSGSTGIAALSKGRNFIGCEIDDEYYDLSYRRLEGQIKSNKKSIFGGL